MAPGRNKYQFALIGYEIHILPHNPPVTHTRDSPLRKGAFKWRAVGGFYLKKIP